ncbi:hypothetical protein [Mycetohabitans rhizoxinica]|uniref:hypothetical protein n=1 Tax=Mycetohabitans rhizoxinica TaxID=412963 RepID=UPI0030CF15F9
MRKMKVALIAIAAISVGVLTGCNSGLTEVSPSAANRGTNAGNGPNGVRPGNDGNRPVASLAQGYYVGMTTPGQREVGIVRDDGMFWIAYDRGMPGLGGFVSGTSTTSGTQASGTFTSTDAIRYDFAQRTSDAERVDASYVYKDCLCGRSTNALGAVGVEFGSTYQSLYERQPTLTALAGTYSGGDAQTLVDDQGVTLQIDEGGTLNARTANACTLTGTFQPRTVGNLYDVTVTAGPAPCSTPGTVYTGAAVLDSGKLLVMATDASRQAALVLSGMHSTAAPAMQ